MRLTLLIILLLTMLPVSAEGIVGKTITDTDVSEVLQRLDREIGRSHIYIRQRRDRIDSLRRELARHDGTDTLSLGLYLRLGDDYNAFNTDSALWCYECGLSGARAIGSDSIGLRFACRKATVLPLLLFFAKSDNLLDSIASCDVPRGLLAERYDAERQSQFYIANFFTYYPTVYDSIIARVNTAQSLMLHHLPEGSYLYKLMVAEHLFQRFDYAKSANVLADIIQTLPDDNPIYARACHLAADIAKQQGNVRAQVYYLALSSISDIRCATLEVTSLQELGRLLYDLSDIERAHDYLSIALRNAVNCHALLRIIQTYQSIPLIEEAHQMPLVTQNMH
ncbi:MAG: hypothetical protein K2K49_06370, partial [Duncaniella sp.]|nr:hypothetical protein [Duncaniella sp.]